MRNDVKRKSKSRLAFEKAWKHCEPSKDTWGVEYMYDFMAYRIFLAGIRFARSQASGGAELAPAPEAFGARALPNWDCTRCGQKNSGWAKECGRCELVNPTQSDASAEQGK